MPFLAHKKLLPLSVGIALLDPTVGLCLGPYGGPRGDSGIPNAAAAVGASLGVHAGGRSSQGFPLLPTEKNVESGISQSKNGTSINLINSWNWYPHASTHILIPKH